jgi:hypothetical protein
VSGSIHINDEVVEQIEFLKKAALPYKLSQLTKSRVWDDGHLEQWETGRRTKTGSFEPGKLEQSRQLITMMLQVAVMPPGAKP